MIHFAINVTREMKNGIFNEIPEKPYNDLPVINDIDIK